MTFLEGTCEAPCIIHMNMLKDSFDILTDGVCGLHRSDFV